MTSSTTRTPVPEPARAAPRRTGPHPAAVWSLVAVVVLVAIALLTSHPDGAGARRADGGGGGADASATPGACAPTDTNPGGDNNYRAGAPVLPSLGRGFTVSGVVRDTRCTPLSGVRVQVWAQSATRGEKQNRASTITGPDGRYRMETDPLEAQFGQLNVHVAYDDDVYEPVYVRTVAVRSDTAAVVDLTLTPAG